MGAWEEVPFVTFNAPAMKNVVRAANINIFKPMMMVRTLKAQSPDDTVGSGFPDFRGLGLDGIVRNDLVSAHGVAGGHIGMVVDLPAGQQHGCPWQEHLLAGGVGDGLGEYRSLRGIIGAQVPVSQNHNVSHRKTDASFACWVADSRGRGWQGWR